MNSDAVYAVYATEHSMDGFGGLQALHGAKSIAIMGDCTCFLVLKVGGKRISFFILSPLFISCTDLGETRL